MSMSDSRTANSTLPPNTFPLSALTKSIKSIITRNYSGNYRIVAELSKLNFYNAYGHCYPLFVEKKQGRIVAEMTGFIHRDTFQRISARFSEVLGRPPADGMEVLFRCKVQFDDKRGLSLLVTDIDPTYTMGEMFRLREEALRKLRAEGVFDRNKSLFMPRLIKRLAVISVETSKGWKDFSSILDRSPYARAITRQLFPSLLQGDRAVASLQAALQAIEARHADFDAVAIIRGGGGETGLDCFDHYSLAKKIATFPIPVLTGIGHATNQTVSELVAFHNLITPSELAHFVLQGFSDFDARTEKAARTLQLIWKNALAKAGDRLDVLGHELSRSTERSTHNQRVRINEFAHRLATGSLRLTTDSRHRVTREIPALLGKAADRVEAEKRRLEFQTVLLTQAAQSRLQNALDRQRHLEEKVEMLDPHRLMKRGFSLVSAGGKTITDASALKEGDAVDIIFATGTAEAEIKKIKSP